MQQKFVPAAGSPLPASEENYVYDGANRAFVFHGAGGATWRLLNAPGVDQILAADDLVNGPTLWTLADRLGTVDGLFGHLADGPAELLAAFSFDAFGRVSPGDGYDGFAPIHAGRVFDSHTGLYYNRARYYDGDVGRFLSEDPLSFAAGDANLYRYVGNSPTNGVDPSGHWGLFTGGIGALLGVGTYLVGSWLTGNEVTWGGALGAAAGGFVAGATFGLGTLMTIGSGAAAGGTGSVVQQVVDNGAASVDWTQVGVNTVAGGLGAGIATGMFGALGRGVFAGLVAGATAGAGAGAFHGGATAAFSGGDIGAGAITGLWQGAVYGGTASVLGYAGVGARARWNAARAASGRMSGGPAVSAPRATGSAASPVTGSQWYEALSARYGAENVTWSRVPAYSGGKTQGVLATSVGDIDLLSGYAGPSAAMGRGQVPGMNYHLKAHVEAHTASAMRQLQLNEATLYLNQSPCVNLRGGCEAMLPRMLGEGRQLRVVVPGQLDRIYVGVAP